MNKDKIKRLRMIAGYVEDLLDNVPASELRTIKDAVHSLHKVADYYDDPVKLVKQRFGNPNIAVKLEGKDLVFKPDFVTDYNFQWTITQIQDYIRGFDWIEPLSNIDPICICDIEFDEVIVDFESKEIRIEADYYVSLL